MSENSTPTGTEEVVAFKAPFPNMPQQRLADGRYTPQADGNGLFAMERRYRDELLAHPAGFTVAETKAAEKVVAKAEKAAAPAQPQGTPSS